GYDPIAETLFNRVDADVYCLEYDSARAGDFPPLRHVPKGKRVILGLVSTKTPVLETKDFLKRQIDAASRYAGLERLGIGPQCGFSSGGGSGQPITQDATRRKLELIMEVSQEIWGNTSKKSLWQWYWQFCLPKSPNTPPNTRTRASLSS